MAITGTTGLFFSTAASASRMASAAGAISAEWKGAETGSMMARLAPFSEAIAAAFSTAALPPEITSWPPPLSLAIWQTPRMPASSQIADTASCSSPMIAAIAPSPTGTAACMALPRIRRRRAVSATEKVPAAQSAEYSPSEWPAT
ncbi:hypothetical protein D3C86_1540490 [compost metagenome]